MTDEGAPAAAGWYPAPHANGEQRYWDGQQWLEGSLPPVPSDPENETSAPTSESFRPARRSFRDRLFTRRTSVVYAIVATALLVASVVGIATTSSAANSTAVAEQRIAELVAERDALNGQVSDLEDEVTSAERSEQSARDALEPQENVAAREEVVASREAAVQQREDAITARETYIQQTSLRPGNYVVGVTAEPGTYEINTTSTSCYWGIYAGGTNYGDIVDNFLGGPGLIRFTVQAGQDLELDSDCGSTWTKIG